jgi:hypothetical protein
MQGAVTVFEKGYRERNPDATETDLLAALNAATWVKLGELSQERQATLCRLWQEGKYHSAAA